MAKRPKNTNPGDDKPKRPLTRKALPPWLTPGNPGNKGGGRPRAAIRMTALRLFDEEGLVYLYSVLGDKYARNSDKQKAAELLAKVGVGFVGVMTDDEDVKDLPAIQMIAESTEPDVPDIDTFLDEDG